MQNSHCIDVCNGLLEGERSAVRAYDKTITKFLAEPITDQLSRIRDNHLDAIQELQEVVKSLGGEIRTADGLLCAFASAAQNVANFIGESSALEMLQTGETTGAGYYEKALEDAEVLPASKRLIKQRLLPQCREHLEQLQQLQEHGV